MSISVIDYEATRLNIKRILDERNISPKEVQEALELGSVQAVYKWLNPKNSTIPSLDNLALLAKFLDCKIDDLLVMKEIGEDNR